MSKPRTKAGRSLLRAVLRKDADAIGDPFGPPRDIRERIAAIEAEAAAPSEPDAGPSPKRFQPPTTSWNIEALGKGKEEGTPTATRHGSTSQAPLSLEDALREALLSISPWSSSLPSDAPHIAAHPAMQSFAEAHERAERLAVALGHRSFDHHELASHAGDWEGCAHRVCRLDRANIAELSPPTNSGQTP